MDELCQGCGGYIQTCCKIIITEGFILDGIIEDSTRVSFNTSNLEILEEECRQSVTVTDPCCNETQTDALLTRLRLKGYIIFTINSCINCRRCDKACDMGIKVSTCNKTVNSLNCINCFECIKQCPKANTLTYGMVEGKIRNKKIAYGLCALLVLFFITQYQERIELDEAVKVEKDVTVGENITVEENVTENEDMVDNATYYIGTGTGYNGDIKVKVGVNNGNIINIKVLEHQDDYEWYSKAKKGIISQILEKQSTDVDNVSGATYSSQGIVQAVKDALENKVEAAE